ncbi:unnamed protein product [Prunus armeniaca]
MAKETPWKRIPIRGIPTNTAPSMGRMVIIQTSTTCLEKTPRGVGKKGPFHEVRGKEGYLANRESQCSQGISSEGHKD